MQRSQYNTCIGNICYGAAADDHVLRIGTGGVNTKCFITGIRGATVAPFGGVLINASHQLGTTTSSIRYKEDVQDIGNASQSLFALRPVAFNMKNDPTKFKQYGLIAEEVHEVLPELVVYDETNRPETLRYQHLPVLLLNEIQKMAKEMQSLELELAN